MTPRAVGFAPASSVALFKVRKHVRLSFDGVSNGIPIEQHPLRGFRFPGGLLSITFKQENKNTYAVFVKMVAF